MLISSVSKTGEKQVSTRASWKEKYGHTEDGVGWDGCAHGAAAVSELGLDSELALLANGHLEETLVPTWWTVITRSCCGFLSYSHTLDNLALAKKRISNEA
jgi:hypothetical protein